MAASTVWKGMILSVAMLIGVGHVAAEPAKDSNNKSEKQQRERRDTKEKKQDEKAQGDREQQAEKRRAEMRQRQFQHLFKGVNLSDEQKTQARTLLEQAAKEHHAWRETHKDELQQIRQEIAQARRSKDKEAEKAAHDKLRALMKDAPQHEGLPDKVRKILTPEQIVTVEQNIKDMREQRRNRGDDRRSQGRERDGDGDKEKPRRERSRDAKPDRE